MLALGSSRIIGHLATAGWALLTVILLLAPNGAGELPEWAEWIEAHGGDKVVHSLLFLVQAWLVNRSLSVLGLVRRAALRGAVLAALFGCVLEIIQLGIPGRSATLGDLVANISGAAIFLLIHRFVLRRRSATAGADSRF